MYSGRQALTDIDSSLQKIRSELSQADYDLERSDANLLNLRQQESSTYRQLAKMRLDSIQAQQLQQQLDYAERQAAQLLIQRNQQITEVSEQISQSQQLQLSLDSQRIEQADKLDLAIQQLEELLTKVSNDLATQSIYQQQQKRTQDLIDMSSNVRDKITQAEQELAEKGKPYRDDKIFSYLWDRHYGTSEYNAGFVTRFFDKKLADHIRYDKARINYFSLNNIPQKLTEHAENLQQEAEQEMQQLEVIEREAEIVAGAQSIEQQIDSERNALSELDKKVTQAEESFSELVKQRERFNLGTDRFIIQALDILVDSFKADPIPQLQQEARQTQSPKDDHLVNQLAVLRDSKQRLEQDIAGLQSQHHRISSKLEGLKDIRRNFKRADFDAYNSGFKNGDLISKLLRQFIADQISSKELWRTFKSKQRFSRRRQTRRYGGIGLPGGIEFPSGGSNIPNIRIPRGVRFPSGWGGGGSGGSGRNSGGGFKTGGGF